MGQKKEVKLEDIATELGVSVVSVFNALKGKKGVSENLRLRIHKKAAELGYQLPKEEKKKEQASYRIGVLVAERYVKEYPSFYMDVYKCIAQETAKKGSITVLEVVDAQKESLQQESAIFDEVNIDGILILGEMKHRYLKHVRMRCTLPVLCVDFYNADDGMDYIVTDSYKGIQLVTKHLIDAGHREIGFVGNPWATGSIMDRYMGYCKALMAEGIEERAEWVIHDRNSDGYGYVIDFELPETLPGAFVCNCDKSAYILIEKLAKRGLCVPDDISVAGFDHFAAKSFEDITLTTYESDKKAMAHISVSTLLKRIEGRGKPEGVRIVEGTLIEGNTVKKREGR